MLKSVCAFLCVAAVSASTLAQPESRNANVREVSGSLSLFVHRTELNKQMQYCVLSPHDNNEHTANTINDMIVVDFDANPETFALCQQGAEGTFTIAQSEIASKKLDNSGCDARFAPMCLTATYDVVHAHTAQSKSDNKAASNKIAGSRSALLIEMIYLDQGPACDSTCMQNNMWSSTFNVDGLYSEASYGLLRFSQDNSRIIQLYMSSSVSDYDYCANGPQKIRLDALAALPQQFPDITVSSFNHMIMSSPALCGVAVSQVGGTLIWMNSRAPDVMAHELAHNLGRQHASTDTTNTDYSTLKSYSTDEDYGDYSCVLGYSGVGLRSFNVIHRFYMGWISSSAVVIPPTSACSAAPMQYTLASAQLPADNTYGYHAIQLNRPRGGKYFISFRAGVGYDVNAPSKWKNVVFVHYTVNSVSRTKFVAALVPGQTYADSMTGLRVTVISTSTTQAKIEILCGATVDMCSMQMTTTKASALTGTFQQTTSLINNAPTWARSDLGAVLAYCSAKALWAVGSHDGSAVTNFDPCSAIVYKSTAYSLPSPTDADNWYSCAGTSCSADTSAVFALVSCDYVGPTSTASITRSSSVSRSRSRSASVSRTASASVSRTPSASVSPSVSSTLSASLSGSQSRSLSASPSRSASVSASGSRSATMSASLSRSASVSASVSRSASATASPSCGPAKKAAMTFNVDFDDSVCEYVEALCAKCEAQPGVVCTYMADLCSQCKAAE